MASKSVAKTRVAKKAKDPIKEQTKLIEAAGGVVPGAIAAVAGGEVRTLDQIFPGSRNAAVRNSLREGQLARVGNAIYSADVGPDGNVFAVAAAVPRAPTKAETFLSQSVPDLQAIGGLQRAQKIELFHEIAKKEGIINNALKKKASLISQEGTFKVRMAKQGKRPRAAVSSDLLTLLTFWLENVNSNKPEGVITGSRGLKQVIRRGSRQALIEGDLFLREQWESIPVPQLQGKSFKLPVILQAISSAEIEISEDLFGLGIELYYWKPSGAKIRSLLNPRDPNAKKVIDKSISSDVLAQLRKDRQVLLDPALLIHVKNAGVDSQPYGDSDVEAALTDIAYARALKALDFVTIESLVNRMLIVKIGDPNPESAFHNLATVQQRVNVFNRLLSEVGPNMFVVWAGHDIETTDVGAHDTLLDTASRHTLAGEAVKMASGVPDPLLTGTASGGNAVAWAGFISLAAVAAELQEEFAQSLSQLGKRVAEENGFEDVDVVFEFSQTLLADREANSKIMAQAYDRGVLSNHSYLEELGKDYDVEKELRSAENESGDGETFAPRGKTMGGPGGETTPGNDVEKGRPTKTDDTEKSGPDRDREDKTT